mmetsp:Transcript_46275/g.148585  ORF Transcript_46275/g.148585 Transcript_46275/m.148585 type:complete len:142 (+) Transcript_46275:43-468(+)
MLCRSVLLTVALAAGASGDSASNSLCGGRSHSGLGPVPESLLPSPAISVASGLFTETASCSNPGVGTKQAAQGPGGCVNVQPGIAGWEGARKQTVLSFVVEPCGMVAPHTHANAVEVNTVLKGGGVVAQLTTQTNECLHRQ